MGRRPEPSRKSAASRADITIDHNTVLHTGNIVTFYSGSYINSDGVKVTGGPIAGFVFTNNLLQHNAYGIFGIRAGVRQRHARVLRARRRRAAQRHGDRQARWRRAIRPTTCSRRSRVFNANFQNAAAQDYRLVGGQSVSSAPGLDGRRPRLRLRRSCQPQRRRRRRSYASTIMR